MNISQINSLSAEETAFERQRADGGERQRFHFNHRLASGEERNVDVYASPVNVSGKSLLFCIVHDVTEQKRSVEALRESLDYLKEAEAIGALGSYVTDVQRGEWTSSKVLDEIFGIDKEYERNVTGWIDLIHPEDRQMMVEYYTNEVVGKGKPFDKEYRIVRPADGAVCWVHGLGRLEFDAAGNFIKQRGVIRDITERKAFEDQLRESEAQYRATFEQAAVGIVHTSFDGHFLRSNARFAEIIGYPFEEVTSLTFQQITYPEDLALGLEAMQQQVNGLVDQAVLEKRYLRKDGSLTWVRLTTSIQRDTQGRALHCIGVVEDINARKVAESRLVAAEEALRMSEERYRIAFQLSLDCVTISRLSDGILVEVNEAFLRTTGFVHDEVIGKTVQELNIWVNPCAWQKLLEMLGQATSVRDLEVQFRRKNNLLFWGLLSATVIEIGGMPCVLAVTRDVSEAKEAEDKITNLAFHDPLTHLPNRRLLLDRLGHTLSSDARIDRKRALLFIDLDDFKALNDTLGQETGDLLLQEAARRLTACVRETDTVARLGSDEFVVMLEDLNKDPEDASIQARNVGEKILAILGEPYFFDGHESHSSASIGVVVFGSYPKSATIILQRADIAMHRAKADGRNTMQFFTPALQGIVNARAALEEDLHRAIKASQFVLYYQPQVEGSTLIGVEALIRWNHPRRGILAPAEFISLAEETGLIVPIGNSVLEAACTQIDAWADRKETSSITVAVNISAIEFRQRNFVEQVLAVLNRTGVNPR